MNIQNVEIYTISLKTMRYLQKLIQMYNRVLKSSDGTFTKKHGSLIALNQQLDYRVI